MATQYPSKPRRTALEIPASRAEELLQKLRRRSSRRRGVWNGHAAGFLAINAFLFFIDLVTGGGVWFPYVTGAMAIPLLSHFIYLRRKNRLLEKLEDEMSREPGLPDQMFKPFRRLHRSTTHFVMGLGAAVSISGYLFLVNAMTGGSFWSIIPAASMALPVVFHGLLLRGRRRSLISTLDAGGIPETDAELARRRRRVKRLERKAARRALKEAGRLIDDGPGDTGFGGNAGQVDFDAGPHPMLLEARRIEREISGRLEGTGPSRDVLLDGVQDLLGEIERMSELAADYARALGAVPTEDMMRDRSLILERRQQGASDEMMAQYNSALEDLDRQLGKFAELSSRQEILELRIRTGVNSLRQINVDLVRVQGDAELGEIGSMVQRSTEELSGYLSDLQQSYQDLSRELGG